MDKYKVIVNDPENTQVLWHKWIEIGFVLRGKGIFCLENNSYNIQEKDIFIVNSYQVHSVTMKESGYLLSFLIAPEYFEQLLSDREKKSFECKSFLYSLQEQKEFDVLRSRLANIIYVWMKSREKEDTFQIHTQMIFLMEAMVNGFKSKESERMSAKGDRLTDLIKYMNEYYKEDISLADLAQRGYMSQSYFSRLFQKETGINFKDYLTNIRVMHAVELLEQKDLTITDVAYNVGFKNVNSFIEHFKQKYGKTPGQYKKDLPAKKSTRNREDIQMVSQVPEIFNSLLVYRESTPLQHAEGKMSKKDSGEEKRQIDIELNMKRKKQNQSVVSYNWKTLMDVGYAKDILYSDVQKQIQRMQREIGFKWIHFHGLLDDDMMIYTEKKDGTSEYHFHYVDQVLDFLLKTGLKPVIEFSYIPTLLTETVNVYQRKSNIAFPKSEVKWEGLVRAVIEHCMKRYGKEEMEKWLFIPFFGFWQIQEKQDRFSEIYYKTGVIIKEYDEKFRIIGVCGAVNRYEILEKYIKYLEEKEWMPDIMGFYCYHTVGKEEYDEGEELKLLETDDSYNIAVSGEEDYLQISGRKIREIMKQHGMQDKPIFLLEWNNNIWQRDLCNDTCYKSSFLLKNILENMDCYQAFGYWAVSDFMEEITASDDLFHGGFGLFTCSGIPKSAYQALWLLNFAGDRVMEKGEGYLITEKKDEIQIFLYNYCHYDKFYRYRHATELSRISRYQVFQKKEDLVYQIQLKNLEAGERRIERYTIGRREGNVYDYWVKIGAPESPTDFEKEILIGHSYPNYRTWTVEETTEIILKEELEPMGIVVYLIKK